MKSGARLKVTLLVLTLVSLFGVTPDSARAQNGIPSEGREFWIGYIRGTDRVYFGAYRGIFALVSSYTDNVISVSYYDDNGNEIPGQAFPVTKNRSVQIPLDRGRLRGNLTGEEITYKSARLIAKNPASVHFYSEGSFNGALYQVFPTAALGKKYVIASHYDSPAANGTWSGDSASSTFIVVAPYDNTQVTITPNASTMAGKPGVNSGKGATGLPQPFTITLSRGQSYQVLSPPVSREHDMSGSTVEANKPVAVFSGHQRGLIGDPGGAAQALDADYRDMAVEQMIPVESWESEGYISIPFFEVPYNATRQYEGGRGDLYRFYTMNSSDQIDLYQGGIVDPYTYQLGKFAYPNPERDNVLEAVNIRSKTGSKFGVSQYDLWQGDLNGNWATGYMSPGMTNVVPEGKWRKNYIWFVPTDSRLKGGQFLNVIGDAATIDKIKVIINAGDEKPLSSLPKRKSFTIPQRPDLRGYQFQIGPGTYLMQGEKPFVVYHYGFENGGYKDNYGYVSTVGQSFGSNDESNVPRIEIDPDCAWWDVRLFDSRPTDEGIADIMLLDDPNGYIYWPPHVSNNVRLVPSNPEFLPGDTSVSFRVQVTNPLKDAYAALWVVDRAGNDTVYTFTYRAPQMTLTPEFANMGKVMVQDKQCATFTLKNTSTAGGKPFTIDDDIRWLLGNQGFTVTSTSPALPTTLDAGETLTIDVCYTAVDTGISHVDTLFVKTDCFEIPVAVAGSGITPIIVATDIDFGPVRVGDTRCKELEVKNEGTAPLILTKEYLLHNTDEFFFADESILPVTLQPGQSIKLEFCYKPKDLGPDSTHTDWGTNLRDPFLKQRKDWSYLIGRAIMPGLAWDRSRQNFEVECTDSVIHRVYLFNNQEAPETVVRVRIEGSDANEWKMVGNQPGYNPLEGFNMGEGDSIWVDLMFKADLSKGYANRSARITADGLSTADSADPYIDLSAIVRHADIAMDVNGHNFGTREIGEKDSVYVTVTNTGDANLVITELATDDPAFVIDSGLAVGDVLIPGQSVVVKVVATVLTSGSHDGRLLVNGATTCDPLLMKPLTIAGWRTEVLGTGEAYPETFVCQDRPGRTVFKNLGTRPVTLKSVDITFDAGSEDDEEFVFDDGTRTKVVNQTLMTGDSIEFYVRYNPTKVGGASAIIRYNWETSDQSAAVVRSLSGIGALLFDTISVRAENASGLYVAKTNESFEVPVRMLADLPEHADIFGYEFKFVYRQDLFRFDGVGNVAGFNVTATEINRDFANLYDTLLVRGVGDKITAQDILGVLKFTEMLARDTVSDFEVHDPVLLDRNGNAVCYATTSKIPGAFLNEEFCGDETLRNFLNDRMPTSNIVMSPNPVKDQLTVSFDLNVAEAPVTIEIFDMLGERVKVLAEAETRAAGKVVKSADLRGIPAGSYTIRINAAGRTVSEKIVIER
jgi:hypothetical protein